MSDERREFADERGAAQEAFDALAAVMNGEGVDRDCDMAAASMESVDLRGWTEDDKTAWQVFRDTLSDCAAGALDSSSPEIQHCLESLAARYGFVREA